MPDSPNDTFPLENIYSFWKTIIISAIIILFGNLFLQILVGAVHIVYKMIEINIFSPWDVQIQNYIQDLFLSSTIISQSIIVSDTASIAALLWFVKRKAPGRVLSYFSFNSFSWLSFAFWQLTMVGIYFFTNYIAEIANVEEPEFMRYMKDILSSQSFFNLFMMFIALVIAAPFFEEMMFRGFMFRGIISSKQKTPGAILLPAVIWSLIHIQYEFVWISLIFLMGIVFGLARYQTGSIITVISMHALNNLLSFLDVSHS
jgi:hypothetical protein